MPSDLSFSREDSPFFSLCNQCWLQDFDWAPSTYQKITVLKALSLRVLHFLGMFIRALLPGTPWTLLLVSTAESCQITIATCRVCVFIALPRKLQTQANPFKKNPSCVWWLSSPIWSLQPCKTIKTPPPTTKLYLFLWLQTVILSPRKKPRFSASWWHPESGMPLAKKWLQIISSKPCGSLHPRILN